MLLTIMICSAIIALAALICVPATRAVLNSKKAKKQAAISNSYNSFKPKEITPSRETPATIAREWRQLAVTNNRLQTSVSDRE